MSRPRVTVWARAQSPRLSYVLDWLLHERLGFEYSITTDPEEAKQAGNMLVYGWREGCFCIEDSNTLFETGAMPGKPEHGDWNGLWAPYLSKSHCQIPFDLLSGIFYLLSRVEEYGSFAPDRHGRYPATSSVLFEAAVLHRPVIDEWVDFLRQELQEMWSIEIPVLPFSVALSYDLDIPRKFQHKSLQRSAVAAFRDLLRGDFGELNKRRQVLSSKQKDPYDSFSWLSEQHQELGVRPFWFVLAAQQLSDFDRNAAPEAPFMQSIISELSEESDIGIHPSYYSDLHPERVIAEKALLEQITGQEIFRSRQHFIKLRFPQTYHALIDAGIRVDYSMGYSTHFGFRAGTGHSFLWYDLTVEQARALRIVPFTFMDTTARFDQNLNPSDALNELLQLADSAQRVHGKVLTIFHNFSLADDRDWKGWKAMYQKFLMQMKERGAFQH